MLYVTGAPTVTVPGLDMLIARSAAADIAVVVALAVLFVSSGSATALLTLARVSSVAGAAGAVTTSVTSALAPALSVPRAQLTGGVVTHEPWLGLPETRLIPDGSVPVSTTPLAASGPL